MSGTNLAAWLEEQQNRRRPVLPYYPDDDDLKSTPEGCGEMSITEAKAAHKVLYALYIREHRKTGFFLVLDALNAGMMALGDWIERQEREDHERVRLERMRREQ